MTNIAQKELSSNQELGNKIKDLTGLRFGKLLVLKFKKKKKNGKIVWLCRCDCGNEKTIDHYALVYNKTVSCGCYQKEYTKLHCSVGFSVYLQERRDRPREDILSVRIYRRYQAGARRRKLSFGLDFDQFKKLIFKNCFYCGKKPDNVFTEINYTGSILYNGVDRIDNLKGYEVDNVVTCCESCNKAKSTQSRAEFYSWISRVYNHLNDLGVFNE